MASPALRRLLPRGPPPVLEKLGGTFSSALVVVSLPPRGLGKPTRQMLTLSDGGTVRLSWWRQCDGITSQDGDATVVILPGMNSASTLPWLQHAVAFFSRRGFTVVVVDYRGVVGLSLTSPRLFAADTWVDLPEIFAAVRAGMRSRAPILAVGHSLGGCCLVKHLSVTPRDRCEVRAAATISAPLNLAAHAWRLESSPKWRAFNLLMMSIARLQLYATWLFHRASRPHLARIDWAALRRATTLRQFEAAAVCPLNGFDDPEEYYAYTKPAIANVDVPLLVLHARDDPIIGCAELPHAQLEANPKVTLVLTPTGGHLGFEKGKWADEIVAAHFAAHVCPSWMPRAAAPRARL